MNAGHLLFVYGTLKRGYHANLMLDGATFIGPDKIGGKLYSLGGFPGVRDATANPFSSVFQVHGEVYRLPDDDACPLMVRALDRYEGYPDLYSRKQVVTWGGHKVWVYEFNLEPPNGSLIEEGVWKP